MKRLLLGIVTSAGLLSAQNLFAPWSIENELFYYHYLSGQSTMMDIPAEFQEQLILMPSVKYSDHQQNLSRLINRITYSNDHWLFLNSAQVDYELAGDPNYSGKKWRGFAGYVDESYIRFASRKGSQTAQLFFESSLTEKWYEELLDKSPQGFIIQIGRSYLRTGRSFDENLLFGWNSQPYQNIMAKWWLGNHIQFETLAIELNKESYGGTTYNRFASMHRGVITTLDSHLSLGFTEAVIYGGVKRNFELSYVNPVNLWHFEQLNGGGEANTMIVFDGEYHIKRVRAYYEFLIDDFQIDHQTAGDREPNELGWIIGFNALNLLKNDYLTIEYSGITNRTYNPPQEYQRWEYLGSPLGHSLENDFDRWMLEWIIFHRIHQFNFRMDYIRKGEGSIFVPLDDSFLDSTWTGESFPSGNIHYLTNLSFVHRMGFKYFDVNYGFDYSFQAKQLTLRLQLTAAVEFAWKETH